MGSWAAAEGRGCPQCCLLCLCWVHTAWRDAEVRRVRSLSSACVSAVGTDQCLATHSSVCICLPFEKALSKLHLAAARWGDCSGSSAQPWQGCSWHNKWALLSAMVLCSRSALTSLYACYVSSVFNAASFFCGPLLEAVKEWVFRAQQQSTEAVAVPRF